MASQLEVRQLGRELKTALELAIASLAPPGIIEKLATASGLLDALAEFPSDTPPVIQLIPKTFERAKRGLADWNEWEKVNLPKARA